MRARSVALLMLALGCGLVASIGITQVIGKRGTGPPVPTGDTESIYVALQEVPFGEPLSAQALRLEPWPKDKIPPGALSRLEDIEGRRTRARLYAGEPVLENKLFVKGASDAGYTTMIPNGYRVVAVKVDKASGSGLILPGDRVDILVHTIRNPSRGILKTSTRTILQDVKVFAVNDVVETEEPGDKTITAQTISLLVTPEHAQVVMMAEELGKIRLIMRSPEDDGIATVQDTTPGGLLDTAESEDRQEEALATGSVPGQSATGDGGFAGFLEQIRASGAGQEGGSVRARQVPGNVHRMQLVSGPEVKEVVLRQDVDQSESGAGVQLWTMSDWEPTPKLDQPQEPLAEEREQVPAAEAPRPEDKGQEGPPTGQ